MIQKFQKELPGIPSTFRQEREVSRPKSDESLNPESSETDLLRMTRYAIHIISEISYRLTGPIPCSLSRSSLVEK